MLSHDKERRERARQIILDNEDHRHKWLGGGWKEEPDADTIGLELGHELGSEAVAPAEWVTHGNAGMEKVSEGLSVL